MVGLSLAKMGLGLTPGLKSRYAQVQSLFNGGAVDGFIFDHSDLTAGRQARESVLASAASDELVDTNSAGIIFDKRYASGTMGAYIASLANQSVGPWTQGGTLLTESSEVFTGAATVADTDYQEVSVTIPADAWLVVSGNMSSYTAGTFTIAIQGVQTLVSVTQAGQFTATIHPTSTGSQTLRLTGTGWTGVVQDLAVKFARGNHMSVNDDTARGVMDAGNKLITLDGTNDYLESYDNMGGPLLRVFTVIESTDTQFIIWSGDGGDFAFAADDFSGNTSFSTGFGSSPVPTFSVDNAAEPSNRDGFFRAVDGLGPVICEVANLDLTSVTKLGLSNFSSGGLWFLSGGLGSSVGIPESVISGNSAARAICYNWLADMYGKPLI